VKLNHGYKDLIEFKCQAVNVRGKKKEKVQKLETCLTFRKKWWFWKQ